MPDAATERAFEAGFAEAVRFAAPFPPVLDAGCAFTGAVAFRAAPFPGAFAAVPLLRAAEPFFVDRTTVAGEPERVDFARSFAPAVAGRTDFETCFDRDAPVFAVPAPAADFAALFVFDFTAVVFVAAVFAFAADVFAFTPDVFAFAAVVRVPAADRVGVPVVFLRGLSFAAAARIVFGFAVEVFFEASFLAAVDVAPTFFALVVFLAGAVLGTAVPFFPGALDFVVPVLREFVTFFIPDSFSTLFRSFA